MVQTRPLSLKSNSSELPNMDILSLFRQTTCSASASIHYNTLKVQHFNIYIPGLTGGCDLGPGEDEQNVCITHKNTYLVGISVISTLPL